MRSATTKRWKRISSKKTARHVSFLIMRLERLSNEQSLVAMSNEYFKNSAGFSVDENNGYGKILIGYNLEVLRYSFEAWISNYITLRDKNVN